jgi:hypothetical protein
MSFTRKVVRGQQRKLWVRLAAEPGGPNRKARRTIVALARRHRPDIRA